MLGRRRLSAANAFDEMDDRSVESSAGDNDNAHAHANANENGETPAMISLLHNNSIGEEERAFQELTRSINDRHREDGDCDKGNCDFYGYGVAADADDFFLSLPFEPEPLPCDCPRDDGAAAAAASHGGGFPKEIRACAGSGVSSLRSSVASMSSDDNYDYDLASGAPMAVHSQPRSQYFVPIRPRTRGTHAEEFKEYFGLAELNEPFNDDFSYGTNKRIIANEDESIRLDHDHDHHLTAPAVPVPVPIVSALTRKCYIRQDKKPRTVSIDQGGSIGTHASAFSAIAMTPVRPVSNAPTYSTAYAGPGRASTTCASVSASSSSATTFHAPKPIRLSSGYRHDYTNHNSAACVDDHHSSSDGVHQSPSGSHISNGGSIEHDCAATTYYDANQYPSDDGFSRYQHMVQSILGHSPSYPRGE